MEAIFSKKKKILVVVLSIIILVSIVALMYSLPSDNDEDDGGVDGMDRTVQFPDDEGSHDEPFESWEVSLSLSSGEEDYRVLLRVVKSDSLGGASMEYMLVDENNVTGKRYYTHNTTEGSLSAENDKMDMNYLDDDTDTTLLSTGEFTYDMDSIMMSNIELNLELEDTKEPTLMGEDGKLYHIKMGTIFGYYQPHLEIEGTIELPDGNNKSVSGEGWLEHLWGGDIMGLNSETWKIKLDNSVDIFVSKFYDPEVDEQYPNDLFLSAVNKIGPQGDLTVYNLYDDVSMNNTDYKIIPADTTKERCWSYGWKLESEDFDLTITPAQDNQLHLFNWLGYSQVEGTYKGSYVAGYALTELNYLYHSIPQFVDVWDTYSEESPASAFSVYTNISYIPPIEIEDIYLNYRMDGGEWTEREMEIDDESWTATIPGRNTNSELEYKLVMTDEAGKVVESDIYNYPGEV